MVNSAHLCDIKKRGGMQGVDRRPRIPDYSPATSQTFIKMRSVSDYNSHQQKRTNMSHAVMGTGQQRWGTKHTHHCAYTPWKNSQFIPAHSFHNGKQNSTKIWCVGIRKIKLESALPPPNALNRMSSALVYTALQEKTPGFLMLHYRTKCYSIPSVKYREITVRPYVPECVHVPESPRLA